MHWFMTKSGFVIVFLTLINIIAYSLSVEVETSGNTVASQQLASPGVSNKSSAVLSTLVSDGAQNSGVAAPAAGEPKKSDNGSAGLVSPVARVARNNDSSEKTEEASNPGDGRFSVNAKPGDAGNASGKTDGSNDGINQNKKKLLQDNNPSDKQDPSASGSGPKTDQQQSSKLSGGDKPLTSGTGNLAVSDSESSSSHFMMYFITIAVVVIVLYIVYHKRNLLFALLLEGRRGGTTRRRRGASGGGPEYRQLSPAEEALPDSDAKKTDKSYVY